MRPKPKPKKTQTGFRADEALLRRFRSRVKLHGQTMSDVIEMLIDDYMARDNEPPLTERELINDLRTILRTDVDLALALNSILRELRLAAERRNGKG